MGKNIQKNKGTGRNKRTDGKFSRKNALQKNHRQNNAWISWEKSKKSNKLYRRVQKGHSSRNPIRYNIFVAIIMLEFDHLQKNLEWNLLGDLSEFKTNGDSKEAL